MTTNKQPVSRKKVPTISIGIPAHNEEANIQRLIEKLLTQQTKHVVIKEIIVVSDNSTDHSVKIVRSIKDSRIRCIDRASRKGLNETQNEIVKEATGDVLVLLDADILPTNNEFIEHITQPVREQHAVGLVGADTIPLPARGFLERILEYSHYIKEFIYKRINNGDTIYLCHGRARAFSKKLYTSIHWPQDVPEDAYSYLYNQKKGYRFVYMPKAVVYFRSPMTLLDYAKQSGRFTAGNNILTQYFSQQRVDESFFIASHLAVYAALVFFIQNPVLFISYIVLNTYIRFFNQPETTYTGTYDTLLSTKQL